MTRDAGLAGQASYSGRNGDPRSRRNAQAALATNVQYGEEFEVESGQRLRVRLGAGLERRNGRICLEPRRAAKPTVSLAGTSQAEISAAINAAVAAVLKSLADAGVITE